MRTVPRFLAFASILLWPLAVHASASKELSLSAPSTSGGTLDRARPLTFLAKQMNEEDFRPVDGEEVLVTIRWPEVMKCNYVGHDPTQFRYYGPMAPHFLASLGHDRLINFRHGTGAMTIAGQALKQRIGNLMNVFGETTQLRVGIRQPGMLVFSFELLWN